MRRLIVLLMCFCLTVSQLYAQNRIITGIVKDENGKPIEHASVMVKGTTIGTKTEEDGSFTLTLSSAAKTLVVSSINFTTQEIPILNQTNVKILLKAETKEMDEVVVVGYGTKPVKEVTGAIAKIAGSKISSEPVASIDQALAGKTAGVQIGSSSGTLADRTAIRMRGINSITSSSQPLVVIDGIPQVDVNNLNGFNSGNGTRFDPLALINPADIETIDVLKDAGAAVLYGSRASNGVILITTKKGRKGNIKTSYDSKVSFSYASKLPSLLNSDQFTTISNEKVANRWEETVAGYPVARPSDINGDGKVDNTNWLKEIYRTGITYDNSISFAGGADKVSVFGSARYLKQEGILTANQLKTGQVRLNLDVTPKSWFKAGIQTAYSRTLNNGILTDGYIAGASVSGWQAPPNISAYNPSGPSGFNINSSGLLDLGNNITTVKPTPTQPISILPGSSYYVNVPAVSKLNRNDNTAQDLRANIYGEIQPIKGLRFTTKFGVQYLTNFEDQYSSPYIAGLGITYGGLVQNQNSSWVQWVWQNYVSYDKVFAKNHKISFVGGTEDQYTKSQAVYTGAANLIDPSFTHIISGTYTNTQPGSTDVLDNTGGGLSSKGLISYFGRVGYSYASKYFVEFAVRRDGYSGFGLNNQFGTFPSISLGWELTKENFMSAISWVSYLKVRGSYGTVGNSGGMGPYDARALYGGTPYTNLNGIGMIQAGNPNLQWESSKKTNIGFDASFLKGRASLTVDYFNNNIDNLLLQAPVIYTVGLPGATPSTVPKNIGSMYNRGIEFTINATPVVAKNFTWSTSFNFTAIKNRVKSLIPENNNADIAGAYSYTVASINKPLGTFFLPDWAGVDPATGNPTWYAADKSLKIFNLTNQTWINAQGDNVNALSSADNVYTGKSGLPTWYGGWDNTLTYKNFDLGISMNFSGGNYVYNATRASMLTNYFSNNFSDILNRWQKPGDKTDVAKLFSNDNTANTSSTRFLEKGDYLRIRTISLGYTISPKLLNKIQLERCRVYV